MLRYTYTRTRILVCCCRGACDCQALQNLLVIGRLLLSGRPGGSGCFRQGSSVAINCKKNLKMIWTVQREIKRKGCHSGFGPTAE